MCLYAIFRKIKRKNIKERSNESESLNSTIEPTAPDQNESNNQIDHMPLSTQLYPNLDQTLVNNEEFRLAVLRNFACPFRRESKYKCRYEVCIDRLFFK